MRRLAYIFTLTVIWAASMAAAIAWTDRWLLQGGVPPMLLGLAGWMAGFATVALAEEIAEYRNYLTLTRIPNRGILAPPTPV